MLPFCGYNMADYFAHWLRMGAEAPDRDALPKIFYVNWFRKDTDGKFLWPGYGENSRVLEWIFNRITDKASAVETPIGSVPTPDAIDTAGLDVSRDQMEELLRVDQEGWRAEVPLIQEYYAKFGDRLPQALADQVEALGTRLG
jgi:phosphoenolpyruvate carboxykinase (GTP)